MRGGRGWVRLKKKPCLLNETCAYQNMSILITNHSSGDGCRAYRCWKVNSVQATIKLCCKGGPKADTGGTRCWTEWGKLSSAHELFVLTSSYDACRV